jgi:hypothetical protein
VLFKQLACIMMGKSATKDLFNELLAKDPLPPHAGYIVTPDSMPGLLN